MFVCVCHCVLPGVSPASHSHPHSRPVRDHVAAVHSSRGLLLPLSCGKEESALYYPYNQAMHPSLAASGGKMIGLWFKLLLYFFFFSNLNYQLKTDKNPIDDSDGNNEVNYNPQIWRCEQLHTIRLCLFIEKSASVEFLKPSVQIFSLYVTWLSDTESEKY